LEFKNHTDELLARSTLGFPSMPLTAFGDYFINNEAAACGLALPAWSSAVFWQIVSVALVILFLISLLCSLSTIKKPVEEKL
jgi:hypothetical protein